VQKRGEESVWYPAECDVSIRPGWFYHKGEDGKVKSLQHLVDLYFKSVGRNSVLLVNVPPDRRGLVADPDVKRLGEFKAAIDSMTKTNLAAGKSVTADAVRGKDATFATANVLDGKLETYWAAEDGATSGRLEVDLGAPTEFNLINIQEPIELGERSKKYRIEAELDGKWVTLARGTIIGHRNMVSVPRTTAQKVALVIEVARGVPAIAEFGIYLSPYGGPINIGSLTASKPAEASNVHPAGTCFGGDKAVDDDMETRWATSDETRACWLEVDLLKEERIGRIGIREMEPRITKFELQYKLKKEDAWQVAYSGGKAGKDFAADFKAVEARYVRLNILEATFAPTIWEFQLFPPKK
jgi:alpha-L-fucosidase